MLFFRRKLSVPDAAREKVLREFEKKIKYRFSDLNLINTALTHPSYLHEKQLTDRSHYERMEFLGDAVLALVVCSHLYRVFPEYSEGSLSDIKSHVVSERALANVAVRMGLGKYILFGSGEARTGGRKKNSILANAFESVIGAIYLDGGYEKARKYILRFAADDIVVHPPDRESSNYKGILQKLSQEKYGADPHYRVITESGPSHAPVFEIEVWVKENILGKASGGSKKEAEQKAAKASIRNIETGNAPGSTGKSGHPADKKKRRQRRGRDGHAAGKPADEA